MQIAIDIGIILSIMGFLFLVLKELATSQKNSVPKKPAKVSEYTYVMVVRFKKVIDGMPYTQEVEGNSLEYLQQTLNNVAFWAMEGATVAKNGVVSHRMDDTGVLREV